MADPLPALESALDAAGARGAGLRAAVRAAPLPSIALPGRPLSVTVATFNAAGKSPPIDLNLSSWLGGASSSDLVAVTLQEAVPLSAGNVMSGAVGAEGVSSWLSTLDAALPAHARLATAQLVGLVLAVYAGPSALPLVRAPQPTAVGGGGGGLRLGNKGLVAVRCLVSDAPAVFLGAHLPSGDAPGDAARRDACLADCLKRGAFSSPPLVPDGNIAARPDPWRGRTGLGAAVAGSAAAFLAGDLNYRLLAPDATVRKAVRAAAGKEPGSPERAAALEKLAQLDELSTSAIAGRGSDRLFAGWTEAGPLSAFLPTFKLVPGGGGYTRGEAEADGAAAGAAAAEEAEADGGAALPTTSTPRTPAWTDRVLVRGVEPALDWGDGKEGASGLVSTLSYSSAPSITLSDHTPVSAALSLTPFTLDPTRVATALEAARRTADAAAMEAVPRCEAAPKLLSLGGVAPGGPDATVRGGLVLSNTGRVAADWALVPQPAAAFGVKEGEAAAASLLLSPPWLGVHPTAGTLPPGEAVAVEVRVVGGHGAGGEEGFPALQGLHAAAGGAVSLDAVLILRTEGGNDEFVLVSAEPLVAGAGGGAPTAHASAEDGSEDGAAGVAGVEDGSGPPSLATLAGAVAAVAAMKGVEDGSGPPALSTLTLADGMASADGPPPPPP